MTDPYTGLRWISNVRAPDGGAPIDIAIRGIRVERVVPHAPGTPLDGAILVEGGGGTILPGLLDAHCHLDQSLTGIAWLPIPSSQSFFEKLRIAERVFLEAGVATLPDRIEALAQTLVANGTVGARTHATVSEAVGLAGVEALLEVRGRLAASLDLQVVAFPQFGIGAPAMLEMLDEAMRMGCDIVGGMDPGLVDRDIEMSLRSSFELASRHDAAVDIHVHDPGRLGLYELERLAAWTRQTAMGGRVVASHALCLGEMSDDAAAATLDDLADAGVAVVTTANPNAAMPRLASLRAHTVELGLGSDTAETSAPFGTSDMFQKANLVAQRQTLVSDAELLTVLDLMTRSNGRILGLEPGRIEPGGLATFVITESRNAAESIASPPRHRVVVWAGRVVSDGRGT